MQAGLSRQASTAAKRGGAPNDAAPLAEYERALFAALRRYCFDRARREGMPPYVVASDRTLRDIARLRPRNANELARAHGIGPAKTERYGAELLSVVRGASAP